MQGLYLLVIWFKGCSLSPIRTSGRMILFTVCLMALVCYNFYTSVFISFTTVSRKSVPINTLADVLRDESFQVGFMQGDMAEDMFMVWQLLFWLLTEVVGNQKLKSYHFSIQKFQLIGKYGPDCSARTELTLKIQRKECWEFILRSSLLSPTPTPSNGTHITTAVSRCSKTEFWVRAIISFCHEILPTRKCSPNSEFPKNSGSGVPLNDNLSLLKTPLPLSVTSPIKGHFW